MSLSSSLYVFVIKFKIRTCMYCLHMYNAETNSAIVTNPLTCRYWSQNIGVRPDTICSACVHLCSDEKVMADAEFTCDLFRFLQLLCEGHNNGTSENVQPRLKHVQLNWRCKV